MSTTRATRWSRRPRRLLPRSAETARSPRRRRALPRRDRHFPFDDEQERGLLHLMLAELLARVDADEHDTAFAVLRVQHDGGACPFGSRDLVQVPALHAASRARRRA